MKSGIIKWMLLPLALCLSIAVAHGEEELERLDNYLFDSPRRPAAIFAHDDHNEMAELDDCAICHHVYDENGNKSDFDSSEDQSCGDCHAMEDDGTTPGLRKAYHQRCKGCHLTKQLGPVTCAQCHVKE
jgi:hypothetical protein